MIKTNLGSLIGTFEILPKDEEVIISKDKVATSLVRKFDSWREVQDFYDKILFTSINKKHYNLVPVPAEGTLSEKDYFSRKDKKSPSTKEGKSKGCSSCKFKYSGSISWFMNLCEKNMAEYSDGGKGCSECIALEDLSKLPKLEGGSLEDSNKTDNFSDRDI